MHLAFFQSSAAPPSALKTPTHMTFRVGDGLYGVALDMVCEVAAYARVSPLTSGDPAVRGEMVLRDGALIVVDMGVRLRGAPIVLTPRSCVLVVRRQQARSGCLFDAPEGLVTIPEGKIELSACLVEEAMGGVAIPTEATVTPENASVSGEVYGFPLYQTDRETILLPGRDMFYPR